MAIQYRRAARGCRDARPAACAVSAACPRSPRHNPADDGRGACASRVHEPYAHHAGRSDGRLAGGYRQPGSAANPSRAHRCPHSRARYRRLLLICRHPAQGSRPHARPADDDQRPVQAAEPPARYRPEEHGPRSCHVRCRGAHRHRQRPLCRAIRTIAGPGKVRNAAGADRGGSDRQWPVCLQGAGAIPSRAAGSRKFRLQPRLRIERRSCPCGLAAADVKRRVGRHARGHNRAPAAARPTARGRPRPGHPRASGHACGRDRRRRRGSRRRPASTSVA